MAAPLFSRLQAMEEDQRIDIFVNDAVSTPLMTREEAHLLTRRQRRTVCFRVSSFEMFMLHYLEIVNCMYAIAIAGSSLGPNNFPIWTNTILYLGTGDIDWIEITRLWNMPFSVIPRNAHCLSIKSLIGAFAENTHKALNMIARGTQPNVMVSLLGLRDIQETEATVIPFRTTALQLDIDSDATLSAMYYFMSRYFPRLRSIRVRNFNELAEGDSVHQTFRTRVLEERQEGHLGPLRVDQSHPNLSVRSVFFNGNYNWTFRHLTNFLAMPGVEISLYHVQNSPKRERLLSAYRFILHASKIPVDRDVTFAIRTDLLLVGPNETGNLITTRVQVFSLIFKMIVHCGAVSVRWHPVMFGDAEPVVNWLALQRERLKTVGIAVQPIHAPRLGARSSIKPSGGMDVMSNLDIMLHGGNGKKDMVIPFPYHSLEERNAFFGVVEQVLSPEFDLPSDAEIMEPDFAK